MCRIVAVMMMVMSKNDTNINNDSQLIFFLTNSYDFRNPGFKSGTGHFTQIVWQETKELGMAKVKSSDGKIIVVARYRPPGNVINHFQENVNPKVNSVLSFRSDSFYTGSVETLSKDQRQLSWEGVPAA